MSDYSYVGSELELFSEAKNWKAYWRHQLNTFIRGDVLEAGAGIGSNTILLNCGREGQWTCLEPDAQLLTRLVANVANAPHVQSCECLCGTLQSVGQRTFDTIIYIDVLEHIADDRTELDLASTHLRPGGSLVVLAPAHQFLFTPFDRAIGHFRRYNRAGLEEISPRDLRLREVRYLDSIGLFASFGNLLLQHSMPTKAQINFWDRWLVPVSRTVDPLIRYKIGKSILAIWDK